MVTDKRAIVYNIRRMIFLAVVLAFSAGAWAQGTLDDGIKMYNYKKYVSARRILEPMADKDPLANYYLGLCYLGSGETDKAGSTFAKYPEDPANMSGNARVAFANKDVAKGSRLAKEVVTKGKKKDILSLKYAADAITYSEGGDYMQAVAWYKELLSKNANDAATRIALGDASRRVPGGAGEAMDNYEAVIAKNHKNSLAYSHIGDLWYDARKFESARDNYNKAKDADVSNPLPYKSLAEAYSRSGRFKQALENIEQYLKLSDNTMNDQLEYVRTLYLAQSYCDAVMKSKEMLRGQLTTALKTEMTGILGFSQIECNDSVEALKNLRAYFRMQTPKQIKPGAYVQLGKLFMKLDMPDSAGYYYSKGINGDTARNKTDLYRQVAEAYKAKKEYRKSAEWYDNMIKANPKTQATDYAWRSIMYYYANDYVKGMETANDFASKYPDKPQATYWQGRIQMAVDSEAKTGAAEQYFLKWFDMPGDKAQGEVKRAYIYMMYYYFNKKDKENLEKYKEKIRAIDPKDRSLTDIEEMEKAPAKKPKSKGKQK